MIGYYEAFSCWKLACIAEGVLARYKAGVMADSAGMDFEQSAQRVSDLADRSLAVLEALG